MRQRRHGAPPQRRDGAGAAIVIAKSRNGKTRRYREKEKI
jgi:hypothetical protein